LARIDLEISSLRDEIGKVKSQIKWYQTKVEETPKRQQELLTLQRNYENLKELYTSLLGRKLEAEIAVSMEKKQKGEQFRVLDPAKIPMRPIKPDGRKIILLTLLLGMGLGCGLAYGVEINDTSYKTPEEVEKELDLPVIISMPLRFTEKELKIQKAKGILKAASVAIGFVVCAVGIVFVTKGIDPTINYVKTALSNLGVL
jgi:capsular polysaccharide biosynthesis protein